jgi:hypothetical protein
VIWGFLGPEGAGKTLMMTYFGLIHISREGDIRTFPGYEITDGHGNVLSTPLEMEEWVTLPPELRDCLIDVDEIQNFFGSDRWMSWVNKLWANVVAQRRHRNLGVHYTVQDWEDLDPRVRKKTHVLAVCRDLYWSSWGKDEGIGRGELVSVNFIDVKGFFTGTPWTPGPSQMVRAKEIWPYYDSYGEVDIWSGMTKVKFTKPEIGIDLTGKAEKEEPAPAKPKGGKGASNEDIILLTDLANTPGIDPTLYRKVQNRIHHMEGQEDEGDEGLEAS